MAVHATATIPAIQLPSFGFWMVWRRHFDVARTLWVSRTIMPLIEPLASFLVLGFGLGRYVQLEGETDYIKFIAPGMVAVFPMWQAVFVCTWDAWIRMDSQRSYDAIIATPLGPEDIAAGDIAWGTTLAFMATVYVMAMALLFGTIDSPLAILVFPVALIHGAMIGAISLWYTSSMKSNNALNYYFTLVILPMFWFGNVFFPASSLPEAFRALGWFVPTAHTVAIYRGLFTGDLHWSQLGDLVWISVVTVVFFLLAIRAMRRRLLV